MATRLSHIRLSPYFCRSTKKEPFNHTSSPTKRSIYPARQVQRDRMAHQATKSQQAGTGRPHHQSHHRQDPDWAHTDGARPLPETPRKPHHQDWNKRGDADLMKSLPRKTVHRKPLQNVNPNVYSQLSTPRGPRQQQAHARKASTATSQAQPRMSEMYTMIDNHLAWNMLTSDLDAARPGSSGTMFVDFGTNGEMEVSYRNGVNKKLPAPPVPSKILMPSKPAGLPQEIKEELQRKKAQHKEPKEQIKKQKPLPPRPSYSSRHDSVISSGAEHEEQIDPFQARPLPQIPSDKPRRTQPQSRKSYPPQVHRTHHSSSPRMHFSHHSSPTPSQISNSLYHIVPSTRADALYTVIDPSGLTMHHHASPSLRPHSPGSGSKPASQPYISGYDPVTRYAYDYDGRTVHVHGSPTPSRPGSYTSEYFDIPESSCRADIRLGVKMGAGEKPLPRLPHTHARAQLPQPPQADVRKRRKVMEFVHKLLHKLDNLGVMKELSLHRHSRSEKGEEAKSWVEKGYVT